jgi:hypothetical protein
LTVGSMERVWWEKTIDLGVQNLKKVGDDSKFIA